MTLKDRLVMITGASAGIGEACAEAFAREGCRLVLAARRRDRLEGLAAKLAAAHGTKAHLLELDVRDRLAVNAAVEGLPVGRQERRHRPAAASGQGLHRVHVHGVQVGPLLAVDLDADEVLVQECRDLIVHETLALHHVAPVAA